MDLINRGIIKATSVIGDIDPGPVPKTEGDFFNVMKSVITTVYAIAGLAGFIFFVYAGYQLIFSTGDPQKMKKGLDTLAWSIAGMVLVVSSGLLFNFIARRMGFTDVVTILSLPTM